MSKVPRLPLFPLTAEVSNQGHLLIGGCDAVELATEFGTPLYVYSKRTLVEHFEKIKEAFSPVNALICYSVKANSNLSLLKALVSRTGGLDIVSGGELARAKLVRCCAEKIVYASVGKTDKEIKDAIEYLGHANA